MTMFVERPRKRQIPFRLVPVAFVMIVPVPVFDAVRMTVRVRVSKMRLAVTVAMNVVQTRDSNPAAEPYQRKARQRAEQLAVVHGERETAEPHDRCDNQRRN